MDKGSGDRQQWRHLTGTLSRETHAGPAPFCSFDPLAQAPYPLGDSICDERAAVAAGICQKCTFAVIVVRAAVLPPGVAVDGKPDGIALHGVSARCPTMMAVNETGKAGSGMRLTAGIFALAAVLWAAMVWMPDMAVEWSFAAMIGGAGLGGVLLGWVVSVLLRKRQRRRLTDSRDSALW